MSKSLMLYRQPQSPSRVSRFMEALRGIWSGPLTSSSPELARLWGSPVTSTGVGVSEETALTYSAVWAAVGLISSGVANLPLVLYRNLPNGGKERFETHPLYELLHDRPNPEMSSIQFRETIQGHALTYGNGYAEIVRDGANRPRSLWPITPDRVTAFRYSPDGDLNYRITEPYGGEKVLNRLNVLHIPGFSWDGITGYGVIAKMRESVGLGLAAERFGGSFFGNGATFGGVISYKGQRPPELSDKNYRDALNAEHQGVGRAHKLLALYNDATYMRMGIPPNEAQFLETRTFQVDEVARWFNIPPHKLKQLLRATFSNIEHQNLEYYIDCLQPWTSKWDQELEYKLIASSERNLQCIEHVTEGLLRADTAARGEFHSKQFSTASITPNEIRIVENRNPIPGGDIAFVQSGFIPLDRVGKWWDAEIDLKLADAEAKRRPPPTPTPPVDPKMRQLEDDLATARRLMQELEDAKDIATAAALTAQAGIEREQAAHEATRAAKDAEIARIIANATSLGTDLGTAQRDVVRVTSELDAVRERYDSAVMDRDVLRQERDEALEKCRHMDEQGGLDLKEIIRLNKVVEETSRERDNVRADAVTHDAVVGELRAQVAQLTADVAAGVADVVAVRVELAGVQTQLSVTDEARNVLLSLSNDRAAEIVALRQRFTEVGVAVRAAVVEDLASLITHEADRARAKQGSPDKLRKWIDDFYSGDFTERCRAILRPSVKAWVVCTNHPEPVEHLLDLLVAQHVEQSVRQLRSVANESDAESLAPALEKVLRRWEVSRAETLADRILKEAA